MSTWAKMSRREKILAVASDTMSRFLYYDRKESEDLPRGSIQEAIRSGELTIDDIVWVFRDELGKEMAIASAGRP